MTEGVLPTLLLKPENLARSVLVVGDPQRAALAAGLLDEHHEVARNREFVTFTGTLDGAELSVCSHGVGSPGAAICFEELIRAGARTLIRAGTCGSLSDELRDGDLLVATAAVRDEGTTARLVPEGYPAAAHHEVVAALLAAAGEEALAAGIVLTSDTFYPSPARPLSWETWQRSRVLAVEMELSALLVLGALHGVRTGGILTVDGNPARSAADMSQYDPHRQVVEQGVRRMLQLSLRALRGLAESVR